MEGSKGKKLDGWEVRGEDSVEIWARSTMGLRRFFQFRRGSRAVRLCSVF